MASYGFLRLPASGQDELYNSDVSDEMKHLNTVLLPRQRAFTIIEMVAVILLIGIVSVVVIPRLFSTNPANELGTRDAIINIIRIAQQNAQGRANVSFQITSTADNWIITAKTPTETLRSQEIDRSSVKLETGSAKEQTTPPPSGDCASGTSYNTPVNNLVINFDANGDVTSFSNNPTPSESMSDTFNGIRICVNDKVESSVCVSRAGFAYAGNCDD